MVIAASFFAARLVTVNQLTDQTAVFDSFEPVNQTWLYSDKIGAAAATGVERARVAIGGPLGLSSREAVYFIAIRDNQGEPLRSHCQYQVTGQPMDTRWWSLSLYDSDTQHYVPNDQKRSSWNSVSIPRKATGNWQVSVASGPQEGAWLPSQPVPEKSFELMLRIYNPGDELRARLPDIALPVIERLSC